MTKNSNTPLKGAKENIGVSSTPKVRVLSFGQRIRAYFFAGILVTAPISITLYLAWLFVNFVEVRAMLVKYQMFSFLQGTAFSK